MYDRTDEGFGAIVWKDEGRMKREAKKLATRQRLLDSARELFAKQGFEATTVEQIAARAGVAKGTFFNYFERKEAVLYNLHIAWAHEEIERLSAEPGPVLPRLENMLHEIVNRIYGAKPLARAFFQGAVGGGKPTERFAEQIRLLVSSLSKVFEEARRRGEIDSQLSPSAVARFAVETFYGVLVLWAVEDRDDLEKRLSTAFCLMTRAIAAADKTGGNDS